jgi:iron(III) transport system permease protein
MTLSGTVLPDVVVVPGPSSGHHAGPRLFDRLTSALRPRNLTVGTVILIICYLVLSPMVYLVVRTFFDQGVFSLGGFQRAYGSEDSGEMIKNSLIYAGGSTVLAVGLAIPLSFVYARTNVRFKRLVFSGSLVPIIMPAILYAPAWIYLSSPNIGLINWVLKPIFGGSLFDIYSIWGMVWIEGLHLMPIAFLLMSTAFKNMDPSLEESAQVTGLSNIAVFRRVTLPLVRPAIVPAILVVAVLSLESFDVPVLIGQRNGIYVFTSQIYFLLGQFPQDIAAAGALGVGLVAIAAVITLLSRLGGRKAGSYQTVTGKGFRPREIDLGKARPFVSAGLLLYFFVAVVLPMISLLYTSLLPNFQEPSWELIKSMSLNNYLQVVSIDQITTASKNSLILGFCSATIVMLLAIIAAWFVVRTRVPGRSVVNGVTLLPLVVPGIVMSLAIAYIYLQLPIAIYGTLWILLIAYVARFMPYAMRYASVSMYQVGNDLEESAYVSGMSWWQTFRKVVIPLSKTGIFAGWVYVFIVSFRELGASILLYTPGREVLPVVILNEYTSGRQDQLAAIGVLMVIFLTVLVTIAQTVGGRSQEGGIF